MGTGPWSNPGAISLLIVDESGGFTGLFVYSPSPGAGNLISSNAAAAGTDPYGNAYLEGQTSYVFNSTLDIWTAVQQGSITPASGAGAFAADTFWTSNGSATSMPGPWTQRGGLLGPGTTAVGLFFPQGGGQYSSFELAATEATVNVPISTDTANSLGTFGVTGITLTEATYYLLPIGPGGKNMVFISIKGATSGSGPTAGSTTFGTTLGTAYQPATNTQLAVATSPNVAGFFVTVGSGGGVALHYPTTGSGTNFSCQGLYDLQ